MIAGLILAGGRGRRLGGAVRKPLVALAGRPLLTHVLDRLPPWIDPRLLSADDAGAYAGFGLEVVIDRAPDFAGPLAGLDAAAARLAGTGATHLVALPADTPFLPADVAARLAAEAGPLPRIARCEGRLHPTVGLWPLARLAALPTHFAASGERSIRGFLEAGGFTTADFADEAAFFNVNTPADLDAARRRCEDGAWKNA